MSHLDRYIAKVVILSVLSVLGILLALDMVVAIIDEFKGKDGDYGTQQIFMYVLMTVPKRIYTIAPLAVLIGSLLGLGMLANNSELTVMRAVGMSVARIGWAAIKPAMLFVVAVLLLGEFVVPKTENYAQSQRALAESSGEAVSSKYGYWHREGDTFMHFNTVLPGGVLYGVTQYVFAEKELQQSLFAEKAIFQGDHWVLQKVKHSDLSENKVDAGQKQTLRWDTELTPEVLKVVVVDPADLSILGLHTYTNYLKEQELDPKRYLLAFWKKVLQPLAIIVMVLVALSCIFGPLRSVTMGYRVFAGILLGVLFRYTEDFLGPASIVFGFEPVFASILPIGIFAIAAAVLLKRAA
jgi:lipopolysaccharide export system permease protein